VEEGNRYVERVCPWELARSGDAERLDAALAALVRSCRLLGELLVPFLPGAAARIAAQVTARDGRLPAPEPLFRRL
jgi:methionyl-tRNA synthetase